MSDGLLYPCDRCHQGFLLLALTTLGQLCARCWGEMGEPEAATTPPDPEQEQAIRRRMVQRGGADRYRALAGKS